MQTKRCCGLMPVKISTIRTLIGTVAWSRKNRSHFDVSETSNTVQPVTLYVGLTLTPALPCMAKSSKYSDN